MGCTPTLSVGLIDFWIVEPGDPPGPTIPGQAPRFVVGEESDPLELTLVRTDRDTGADLTLAGSTIAEPSPSTRTALNAAGTEEVGGLSLAGAGEGVTIAVRWWPGAGQVQGSPAGPLAKSQQLAGFAGMYAANPTAEAGVSLVIPDPTAGSPVLSLRRYNGGSPVESAFSGGGAAVLAGLPFLAVLAVEGDGAGGATAALSIDGTPAGTVAIADIGDVDLGRFTLGDAVESDGGWSQGAVWSRVLTPDEVAAIGADMDCFPTLPPIGGGGPGSEDPLLHEDGTSRIHPRWIVPRRDPVAVVATDGAQRHTRRVSERVARIYELVFDPVTGEEHELLAGVLRATRLGATAFRWRHPTDDAPGPVSTAPRWRLLGDLSVTRTAGGELGSMTITIEELV